MKFRPKIDTHDFEVKEQRARRFLEEGDKVKVTMMFRGREVTHPEIGLRHLQKLAAELDDVAGIEASPRLEGRNMTMVLAPLRSGRRRQEAPGSAGSDTQSED